VAKGRAIVPGNNKGSGVYTATLIEGDGIGPDVVGAALQVLEAARAPIRWEPMLVGQRAYERTGALLPAGVLASIKRNRIALKGPLTTPVGEGMPSLNVRLRKELDLYACVRPVRSLPGVPALYADVNLTVIRENTEDLYAGIEHEIIPGVVESLKIITKAASLRIARFAFLHVRQAGYRTVTAIHKANIMKLSDGLFLDCCRQTAREFADIQYTEVIVDNACMKLVMHPHAFGVLLTPNLYGDILSDLAAGLGVVPGANIGDESAVFEAVHGSWPEAAAQGIANPTALILTAAMMLRYLGEEERARAVEGAVRCALAEGIHITPDLGGTATTQDFTDAVIRCLGRVGQQPAGAGK